MHQRLISVILLCLALWSSITIARTGNATMVLLKMKKNCLLKLLLTHIADLLGNVG